MTRQVQPVIIPLFLDSILIASFPEHQPESDDDDDYDTK